MIAVHGLKNCDTCRRALKWLDAEGIRHRFYDLRRDGIDRARLEGWIAAVGWEVLLNRRSTTWRGLADADKEGLDESKAVALLLAHPALVKRPVFETEAGVFVGFGDAEKARLKGGRGGG